MSDVRKNERIEGRGCRKKQKLFRNGTDREILPTLKRADFQNRSCRMRRLETPVELEKLNDDTNH